MTEVVYKGITKSLLSLCVRVCLSELKELECGDYIQKLHRETHRALYEHVRLVCGDQVGRLGSLLALLDTLRSVDPDAVAELFFRPVTGSSNVEERVIAMFGQQ